MLPLLRGYEEGPLNVMPETTAIELLGVWRHGLRGAEAASAALAELRRAEERYGYTGSRLSRRCGESSSALRFVPLATGLLCRPGSRFVGGSVNWSERL